MRVTISTSDQSLESALMAAAIPEVVITSHLTAAVSPQEAWDYLVDIRSQVALGLFTNWLYDKLIKGNPQKTCVNGQQITQYNINHLHIVIQNPQQQQDEKGSDESNQRFHG